LKNDRFNRRSYALVLQLIGEALRHDPLSSVCSDNNPGNSNFEEMRMSRFGNVSSSASGRIRGGRSLLPALALLLSASGMIVLSGCGTQGGMNLSGGSSSESKGVTISGKVHGGQQPVGGADVYLYAVGTVGYATAPTLLGQTTTSTDGNGTFTYSSLNYTCPAAPGDQVFLLAKGGNPGLGTASPIGVNPNLVLIEALGTCASIPTNVVVNEVTTVASAYALAQFLTYSGTVGTPPLSQPAVGAIPSIGIPTGGPSCSAPNWLSTGANTCNYVGLKNAFATVPNLVDLSTGQVPSNSKVPSYTTAGINGGNDSYVPSARINTLANILSACVNSTGGDATDNSTICGALFEATTPGSTGTAPTDTLQAILNLAQSPYLASAANTEFFNLAGINAPFQTPAAMSAAPNDWTLALGYTGGGFVNATLGTHGVTNAEGLAIDAQGNIWTTSTADQSSGTGGIVGFYNNGVPITPATTSGAWGAYQTNANYPWGNPSIGLDGNIWYVNYMGTLTAINQSGASVQSPIALPASVAGTQPTGVALDATGNIWVTGRPSVSSGGLVEYNSSGLLQSPSYSFSDGMAGNSGVALDNAGYVWISAGNSSYQVAAATGDLVHEYTGVATFGSLAVDTTGNVFGCNGGEISELIPNSTSSTPFFASGGCDGGSAGSSVFGSIALDGAGNLWSPRLGDTVGYLSEVSSGGTTLSPATYGYQGKGTSGGFDNDGEVGGTLLSDKGSGQGGIAGVAVDGSGNVWALNALTDGVAAHQLVEFVGLGAPTVQPTVLALKYSTQTTLP
jgi:hypothetical protein